MKKYILLLLGALAFSREYSRYVKKHISECEEFIAFIKKIGRTFVNIYVHLYKFIICKVE